MVSLVIALHLVEEIGWYEDTVATFDVYGVSDGLLEVRVLHEVRQEEVNGAHVNLTFQRL